MRYQGSYPHVCLSSFTTNVFTAKDAVPDLFPQCVVASVSGYLGSRL